MRTTLNLDDELVRRATICAEKEGETLSSLVEDALRDLLERHERKRAPIELPVWSGSKLLIDLDLDDSSAIWEAMEDNGRL